VRNRDNVTVKNLTLKGAKKGSYNGVVAGYNANGLRVEDCDIEVELTQGGVYLSEGGGQVITGNDIYNPRAIHFLEAADLIFVRNTNSNGWLIENNRLISRGSPDRDPTWAETLEFLHVDNIQTIDCNGGTVNANYIEINIDVERHFHGVLIENGSGTYTVTNNYMVNKFVDNGASGSDFEDEQLDFILGMYGSSSSKYLVYHNTIVGDGEQLLRYAQTNPDSEFKNNILYRRTRGRGPIAKIESGSSNGKWSHNLFYNHGPANGTVVDSINGWRNVSSFESLTGGSGSVFGDPNFVLEGPDVLAGSPALNAGTPIAGVNADLDGNSRDATPTIGAIEVGGATVTESISLEGPLVIAADGTETFIIDYVAGQQRDIILDVFDSNWSWKGQTRFEDVNGSGSITGQVDYGMISTATGFVLARIIADGGNWETAVEEARLDVDITSTVPEFVAVSGPTNVPVAGSVTYTVDYNANSTRDIVIGIYDANWKWIRGKRFRNVSGSGTLSHTINYTTKPITTATANVKASMRPPGGNWRTEVATDYIRDIVVGDNTAPDVEYDLWDATPSANVSVHDSWGVTGLAPGRHLLLPNFDLDTGYSQFEFQYTTGFAGASSVEVRLGSPTVPRGPQRV